MDRKQKRLQPPGEMFLLSKYTLFTTCSLGGFVIFFPFIPSVSQSITSVQSIHLNNYNNCWIGCSESLYIYWCGLQRMNLVNIWDPAATPQDWNVGNEWNISTTITQISTEFDAHNHDIQRMNANDFVYYPVRYKTQLLACYEILYSHSCPPQAELQWLW